jgi:hypothetical protein
VVGDQSSVAPQAHVDLEDVRAAGDRACERVEAVLRRSSAVAAMSDAERIGDRLQRSDAQGSWAATSMSW